MKVGDRLGSVGFSGAAAFPHLHIEVRHQGQVVDPFRGEAGDGETCGPGPVPLWTPAVLNELAYRPTQLLDAGFAAGPVQLTEPEEGTVVVFDNAAEPAAMVGWGWAINLEPGDELTVVLDGPRGEMARNSKTMPRRKAQYLLFAGRRTPPQGWPAGAYRLSVSVTRDGAAVVETVRELSVH